MSDFDANFCGAGMKQKTKQPVQGVKKEESGSKGKEVVRSANVKSSISISNSKSVNAATKTDVRFFFPPRSLLFLDFKDIRP